MSDFYPLFVRVMGLATKPTGKNPFTDLADPKAHPMVIVCFGLDKLVHSGYYLPEVDEFHELIENDDDTATTNLVPKSDPKHQACLDTITKFVDHLATGGTPDMENLEIPSCYHNPRVLRRKTPSPPPSVPTEP